MAEKFIKAELKGLRQGHQAESFLRRDRLGQIPLAHKWRREKAANGWRLFRVPQGGWTDGSPSMLRNRPIKSITRGEIVDRLDEIRAERGKYAARHALDAIRRLLNWAAQGDTIDVSPIASLKVKRATGLSGDDMRRERVLTEDELRALWRCAGSDAFGNLVRLLVLTGQRRSDWAQASWTEITRTPDGDVLVIPGTRFKNKREHRVPLTPQVVKLLQKLPRFDRCDYVLTNDGRSPLAASPGPSIGSTRRAA
jgi:integrase